MSRIVSYITGLMDVIHSLELKITRKHNVSETGFVSVFMWMQGDTYCVRCHEMCGIDDRYDGYWKTFFQLLRFCTICSCHRLITRSDQGEKRGLRLIKTTRTRFWVLSVGFWATDSSGTTPVLCSLPSQSVTLITAFCNIHLYIKASCNNWH
jgi:hypothetical protein